MPHRERVSYFSGAAPHAARGHSPEIKKRATRWGTAATSHQAAKPIDLVQVAGWPALCKPSVVCVSVLNRPENLTQRH
jgi:hypothetical protein